MRDVSSHNNHSSEIFVGMESSQIDLLFIY